MAPIASRDYVTEIVWERSDIEAGKGSAHVREGREGSAVVMEGGRGVPV